MWLGVMTELVDRKSFFGRVMMVVIVGMLNNELLIQFLIRHNQLLFVIVVLSTSFGKRTALFISRLMMGGAGRKRNLYRRMPRPIQRLLQLKLFLITWFMWYGRGLMQKVDPLLRLLIVWIREGFGVSLNLLRTDRGKRLNQMSVVVLGRLLLFGVTIVKQHPKFMLDGSMKRLVEMSSAWRHQVRREGQVFRF